MRPLAYARASAPIRKPPSAVPSTPSSGSALMSTRRAEREIPARIRSTSVVPPARNALSGSRQSATAPSTVSTRL